MQNFTKFKTQYGGQSGNAVVIVLVVLVVVAVGALAYLSGQMVGENKDDTGAPNTSQVASTDTDGGSGSEVEPINIEPGNPVVARVGDQEITRLDVFQYVQTLPEQTRQLPIDQLFPMALEQVVNARVISANTQGVNLDNDPQVQEQLEQAKQQIVRSVFIQKQVDAKITEERLQALYQQYSANFPEIEEVRASHILVDDKSLAEDLLTQLEQGADFAELAREHSKDATAESGGQLNFFTQQDVVPEFGQAAFSIEPGNISDAPVQSDFGYHIIKVEEKRMRPPAPFEQARPFLESQLRRAALDEVISEWREEADIERYDINGDPIEPAAAEVGSEESAEENSQDNSEGTNDEATAEEAAPAE